MWLLEGRKQLSEDPLVSPSTRTLRGTLAGPHSVAQLFFLFSCLSSVLPHSRADKGSSQAPIHSPLPGCRWGSRELCGRPGRLLALAGMACLCCLENRGQSGVPFSS